MTNKDFNVVRGQFEETRTLKIINFQITILDEYAVASFDEPNFAKKLVRIDNKAGNMNVKFNPKINSAIEFFKGKNKNEITKIIITKLRALPGAKVKQTEK